MTKPNVFISSSAEGLTIARELGRQLEPTADVVLWSKHAFYPREKTVESLIEVADRSDFAVLVFAGDDTTTNLESQWPYLFFELGLLFSYLGPSRTFVVFTSPSIKALLPNLAGLMNIELSNNRHKEISIVAIPATIAIQKMISEINIRKDRKIDYHSCFISYSWADKEFAIRLYDDLQKVGIRCWLDEKEIRVGEIISNKIEKAIQAHDKVLLVLSESSVQSSWVKLEIKHALRMEYNQKKTVLFPIRLDNAVFNVSGINEIDTLREKQIGDFSQWQVEGNYQRAFSRLVRDLAISASVESGSHS